jgi:hypothetical protein
MVRVDVRESVVQVRKLTYCRLLAAFHAQVTTKSYSQGRSVGAIL